MAKKTDWTKVWPYVGAGVVIVAVAAAAVMTRETDGQRADAYGPIVADAQKAAEYRAAEREADMDAEQHARMADYHADAAVSATSWSSSAEHGVKAAGEKVQEGTATVREEYNGALAEYHRAEMEEGISDTLPVTPTLPDNQ